MTDIIHETEIIKTSEEPVEEIKRPRGRPRKAEEDKNLGKESEVWKVNVIGTENVARACEKTGKKISQNT